VRLKQLSQARAGMEGEILALPIVLAVVVNIVLVYMLYKISGGESVLY
jgi:hypothetical protein